MKFQDIYATADYSSRYYFELGSDVDDYFCTNFIQLYGVPETLSEDDEDEIYGGDVGKSVYIGKMLGTLILGCQLTQDGYDFRIACDDISGDLEFVASSLIGSGLIRSEFDLLNDIYYIDDLEMDPDYDDTELKLKILEKLPEIVFKMYHVRPSMLTYYPMPLENVDTNTEEPKHDVSVTVDPAVIDMAVHKSDKIMRMKITDDELDNILRNDKEPFSYPTAVKDPRLWDLFENDGFEEAGQTRLLYKIVDL